MGQLVVAPRRANSAQKAAPKPDEHTVLLEHDARINNRNDLPTSSKEAKKRSEFDFVEEEFEVHSLLLFLSFSNLT